MPAAVVVSHVSKQFAGTRALIDLSLDVGRGEIFGLLGPNGAGKTTLLRLLTDLLRPDEGAVELLGAPPVHVDRRRIAYLPEERGLYEREPVGELVEYFAALRGLAARAARTRTAWWLERLGIAEHRRRRIDALSKGNQQRVQLATVLVADPEVALLDEPFSGLDPMGARLVGDIFRELAAHGSAVIVSTHQMRQAETLCDRVAVLVGGRRVRYGTPSALAAEAVDPTLESVFITAATEEVMR